jgi:hypothetical protein
MGSPSSPSASAVHQDHASDARLRPGSASAVGHPHPPPVVEDSKRPRSIEPSFRPLGPCLPPADQEREGLKGEPAEGFERVWRPPSGSGGWSTPAGARGPKGASVSSRPASRHAPVGQDADGPDGCSGKNQVGALADLKAWRARESLPRPLLVGPEGQVRARNLGSPRRQACEDGWQWPHRDRGRAQAMAPRIFDLRARGPQASRLTLEPRPKRGRRSEATWVGTDASPLSGQEPLAEAHEADRAAGTSSELLVGRACARAGSGEEG